MSKCCASVLLMNVLKTPPSFGARAAVAAGAGAAPAARVGEATAPAVGAGAVVGVSVVVVQAARAAPALTTPAVRMNPRRLYRRVLVTVSQLKALSPSCLGVV